MTDVITLIDVITHSEMIPKGFLSLIPLSGHSPFFCSVAWKGASLNNTYSIIFKGDNHGDDGDDDNNALISQLPNSFSLNKLSISISLTFHD